MLRDVAVAVLLLVGCFMSLTAGIGLLRFPDLLSRMHAATKPQVLGLLCLVAAVALAVGRWQWVPFLALVWLLQLLTAPVSAHMVGRAAYRSKHLKEHLLVEDDLAVVVAEAERQAEVEAGSEAAAEAGQAEQGKRAERAGKAPDAEPAEPEREPATDPSGPARSG